MFKIAKIPISVILESFKKDSEYSSTRVMSYLTWKFTKWWMIMFGGVELLMFVMDGFGWVSVSKDVLGGLFQFFTWSTIILLTATYSPKTLSQWADGVKGMKLFASPEDKKE